AHADVAAEALALEHAHDVAAECLLVHREALERTEVIGREIRPVRDDVRIIRIVLNEIERAIDAAERRLVDESITAESAAARDVPEVVPRRDAAGRGGEAARRAVAARRRQQAA